MNISVGKKIRELRATRNMTQAQLAKRIGMTTSAVSSYEVSDRQPSYDVLIKIAKQFNVTTDFLLGLTKHNDDDTISVFGLCAAQKETVQQIIETYQKFNEISLMVLNADKKENADDVIESICLTSLESFKADIKSRLKY
jgi:transcriptional regulator with XRE-family HTH domain